MKIFANYRNNISESSISECFFDNHLQNHEVSFTECLKNGRVSVKLQPQENGIQVEIQAEKTFEV